VSRERRQTAEYDQERKGGARQPSEQRRLLQRVGDICGFNAMSGVGVGVGDEK